MKNRFLTILVLFCGSVGVFAQSNNYDFIIGEYSIPDPDNIVFNIDIASGELGYEYSLQTSQRQASGQVIIMDYSDGLRLVFKGCFYDEPPEHGELNELSGEYVDGELFFQNYGNSMNQFEIFSGYPKYLILWKNNR